MNANDRRKQIIEVLCERRFEKIENLAFEFGVTTRTIKTDISELSLSHPIITRPGKYDGGVYIAEGYYLGRQYLTEEQKNLLSELKSTDSEEQAKILQSIISKFGRPNIGGTR